MNAKININLLKLSAIDYAAYIMQCATPEDCDTIAAYGAGVIRVQEPTDEQENAFWMAMGRAAGDEYRAQHKALMDNHYDNEARILENEVAKIIARLNAPRNGRV